MQPECDFWTIAATTAAATTAAAITAMTKNASATTAVTSAAATTTATRNASAACNCRAFEGGTSVKMKLLLPAKESLDP